MNYKTVTNNYYISSFFWSTLARVLNAIFGFVSVPLLLGYFGKADYGLLSIAIACNSYMHIMDLGMNTGAVRFFSQWKMQGEHNLINRVARTNISFYLLLSIVNVIGLLVLAFWGESLFSVTHGQFLQLRLCLIILALFSPISWIASAFNQLLIADKQISFTQQVSCVQVILKLLLIVIVLKTHLTLTTYFFFLTLILALAILPYISRCLKYNLINNIWPANYWSDFKVVLTFSLSIFALSLFQTTATQSRPIILSMFAESGAEVVADFRIIEVIPQFIIMICGTFLSIFLPKTTEIYTKGNQEEISGFIKKWTSLTTVLVCCLCFPFIVSANDILTAYVGEGYSYLNKWLILWCVLLILQLHSTPAYSMLMAKGKTKMLVIFTAIASVVSVVVNALFCKAVPVGSAVIGYATYMVSLVVLYYMFFYKRYLNISRRMVAMEFFKPFILGIIACVFPYSLGSCNEYFLDAFHNGRISYLVVFIINTIIWFVPYVAALYLAKILTPQTFKHEK